MRGIRFVRIGLLAAGCISLASCLGPPLIITPATLPNAVEGRRYDENLNTSDSRGLQWEIAEGALPPGLLLDRDSGMLGGTPALAGTYDFTVRVTESLPRRIGERAYRIEVIPRLTVQFAPPPGRINEPYEYTPFIDGGVPPYTATIIGLPGGLDYDTATGTISGTPLTIYAGLPVELDVVDRGDPQQADTQAGVLVIAPPGVTITTTALPMAPIGEAYAAQLEAEDGQGPYTWRIARGNIPSGLRLNRFLGEIAGVPTLGEAATERFTVSVTDSGTPASSDSQSLKIVVPVVIATTNLPDGRALHAYQASVAATAGLAPYTWAISAGDLPDGLELDENTGVISGEPSPLATGQTFTFTIAVTDSDTPPMSAAQELSIQILP